MTAVDAKQIAGAHEADSNSHRLATGYRRWNSCCCWRHTLFVGSLVARSYGPVELLAVYIGLFGDVCRSDWLNVDLLDQIHEQSFEIEYCRL